MQDATCAQHPEDARVASPAWQHRRCGEPSGMEGHLEPQGVSGGLTCPPGQEELSPRIPRVPPVRPLLKAPVALASETGEVLPPRFTLVPVGDEGPAGPSLPRDHVLHPAPRV